MRGVGGVVGGSGAPRPPPWKSGSGPAQEDEPETGGRAVGGSRKKGSGLRSWLMVDSSGQAQVVEAGKQTIMRRTGLPARDLRILDPLLSYPSTVLGRERAIVINLEHIKAIITAHEVLLLNFKDPSVAPFVHELQCRLQLHHLRDKEQEKNFPFSALHAGFLYSGNHRNRQLIIQKEGRIDSSGEWTNVHNLEETRSRTVSPSQDHGNLVDSRAIHSNQEADEKGKGDAKSNPVNSNKPRVLPFEFIALEACLEAACSCLENEAATLEKEAHPALDKLTSKISTLNLEHVRQIKSRLVAISGRVQKVRDELEHLLDDDDDMAEMYLTDKLMQQHVSIGSSRSSLNDQGEVMDDERLPTEISSEDIDIHNNYQDDSQNIGNHDRLLSRLNLINEDCPGTHTCSTRSGSKHLDVEELEMLLEAYFVQIDSTLNNLSTLREYVDDTEDYINIMLDDKQNHLLQMGVVLTTATLIVSAFVVMAGIFGMNIQNDLFDEKKSGTPEFLWTVGGGATGSLFLYAVAIAWCKHKRLLE